MIASSPFHWPAGWLDKRVGKPAINQEEAGAAKCLAAGGSVSLSRVLSFSLSCSAF